MNWTVQFVISIAVLAASVFYAIYCEKNKVRRPKLLSSFNIMFLGVAIALFFVNMPYYYYDSSTNLRGVQSVFVSLYSVLRSFALDGDYTFFMETVAAGENVFNTVYLTYTLLVMVAAPFFTFGVVLSFFKDLSAYVKYYARRNCTTYIFSALNEKSVALAKSLQDPKLLVFAGVDSGENEYVQELAERAAELGAVCFKKDVLSIKFGLKRFKKETHFFVIGDNDAENIRQTLKLIETNRDRENTQLYLFSTSKESELVLAATNKGKMKVRRIDEIRSLINRVLYDEGTRLFDTAKADEYGTKHISAVLVGLGQYGTTMLKSLSWYCQMDGYKLKITAFDKDEKAWARAAYEAPELMDEANNGVFAEGEPGYEITVHSGIDANTQDFVDIIKTINDATYVFVALGTDEDNVRVATDLRMRFERMKIKPDIVAIVHSSEERAILEDIENHKRQRYDVKFIGDIDSSYTEDVVIGSALEKAALQSHLAWDGAKAAEFWEIEYNYRSSIATALHKDARQHCGVVGVAKPEDQLTEEEKATNKRLIDLEHRRWFAYMRAEGYVYSGTEDESSRNELGKMHHNMVPTSRLSKEDAAKDLRVGAL